MYGVSIVFLVYCYLALLMNPRWYSAIQRAFVSFKKERSCVDDVSSVYGRKSVSLTEKSTTMTFSAENSVSCKRKVQRTELKLIPSHLCVLKLILLG